MGQKKRASRLEGQWEEIAAAYTRGLSIADLANHYECSDTLIRRLLKEHGIEIRPAGPRAKSTDDKPPDAPE